VDDAGNPVSPPTIGEIVIRGENVMAGYWNNERATAETLRDGWLWTGDLGFVDTDKFLHVLGRRKSLLIGHDGEKYSPEGIEEAIVSHSPYIEQVMLCNNQFPYTVALIVPSPTNVLAWLKERGLSGQSNEGQEAVLMLFKAQVDDFAPGGQHAGLFVERWLPTTFAVLGEPFTEQNGFLNSTLKMVRGRIAEYYKTRIEYMFTAEGKNILNPQNKTIIRRIQGS